MSFQSSIQIIELLCGGFPGQSDFFPMGHKSKQGDHMLNMRMAHAARIRDRPARDSTFTCLNRGGRGQGFASLKK
jgi:hypothetical protein